MKHVLGALVVTTLATLANPTLAHADRAPEPEPALACHEASPSTKITATFGAETSLRDLALWAMGFTCKNIVIDVEAQRYAPRVTVMAPRPMTPKQALALFVDALVATGLSVTVKKDSIVVKLGPKLPRNCPAPATISDPLASADPTKPDPAAAREEAELTAALDAGIKRIDDTHIEIKQSLVDKLLANPMPMAKGARVVPAVKDGKPSGFKLYAIRPGSLYARLGILNGDNIKSINGFDLTSADKALEVYTKLRQATQLEIVLERRGTTITLAITVK